MEYPYNPNGSWEENKESDVTRIWSGLIELETNGNRTKYAELPFSNVLKCKDKYWLANARGMFLIFNEDKGKDTNIFLKALRYDRDDLKTSLPTYHAVPDKNGDYVYSFYHNEFTKINTVTLEIENKIDSITLSGKYFNLLEHGIRSTIISPLSIFPGILDENEIIWFDVLKYLKEHPKYTDSLHNTRDNKSVILTFDTKKDFNIDAFTTYDINDVLKTDDIIETLGMNGYMNNEIRVFLLNVKQLGSKTLIIHDYPDGTSDTTIVQDTIMEGIKLLKHETATGFSLIPMPDDYELLREDINFFESKRKILPKLHKWGEDELALGCGDLKYMGDGSQLLIYNLKTKQWRNTVVRFPAKPHDHPIGFPVDENATHLNSIALWNGKRYFSVLYANANPPISVVPRRAEIYVHDTTATGIEDEIEAGIIPDLWIRKVTPNPATSSVNVNIMYHPSSIYSNDLEVGLYNYMGEKVINLTPLGTYTDHNHTWEATFDIPKRLASGMYFLNVRSGDESRTKGIAIY